MPVDRELRVGLLDQQPGPPRTLQAPDLVVAVAAASQPGLELIGLLERRDRMGRLADPVAQGQQQDSELVDRSGMPAAGDVLQRVKHVVDRLSQLDQRPAARAVAPARAHHGQQVVHDPVALALPTHNRVQRSPITRQKLVEAVADRQKIPGGLPEQQRDRARQAIQADGCGHAATSSLSANSPGRPAARTSAATVSASYDTRSIKTSSRPELASSTAKAPRGSPSLGLPTEPQLTNSTPPCSRTHGLCVWPNTSTSASSPAASRSYSDAGLSSKRYSLTFRGEPCTRGTAVGPTSKRRSNGRSRMKSFAARSVCASVHSTERSPISRSCGVTYAQPQSSRSRAI